MNCDAARYQWLRDHSAYMRPCYVTRQGYRKTTPDAPWEKWDEFEGWICSTHAISQKPFASMDEAIDDAMKEVKDGK